MTTISGSCLCGQVSYSGDTEPMMVINCHCTDCQKASGSSFMTNVMVKADAMKITGETKSYHHKSDAGSDMTKVNCTSCGSPVYGKNSRREGVLVLRAGLMDQKELIKPVANIFCDSAMPETAMNADLKTVARMPG